jgi:hypothetical protein
MNRSVIIQRDFGGNVNNMAGDIIGNLRKESSYGGKVNVVFGHNIVTVRTESSYGKEFHCTA